MSRKVTLPCTIDPALLEVWKKLKRKKDRVALAKLLKVSHPVIDNALNFGHITADPDMAKKITKFFEDRLTTEREDAARLTNLATQ